MKYMRKIAFVILFLCLWSCASKNMELYIIDNPKTYDLVYQNITSSPNNNSLLYLIYGDSIIKESPLPKTAKESKVSRVAIVSGSDTIFEDLYSIDFIVDSIVSKKNNYIIYGGEKHAVVVWPKIYGKPDIGINKKASIHGLKITNYEYLARSSILFPYFWTEDGIIEIKAWYLNFFDRCYYHVPVNKP